MAIKFNGTSQYLSIPVSTALGFTTAATLVARVNSASVGTTQRVICSTTARSNSYVAPIALYVNGGKACAQVSKSSTNSTTVTGATTLQNNVWYTLAAVYDGSTVKVYVNGVQDGSAASTGNLLSTNISATIGCDQSSSISYQLYYNGTIDALRFYNRALSADELLSINNLAGEDLIVYGLAGRWPMNENREGLAATGTGTIKDFSNNGLNITPVNSPIYAAGVNAITRAYTIN